MMLPKQLFAIWEISNSLAWFNNGLMIRAQTSFVTWSLQPSPYKIQPPPQRPFSSSVELPYSLQVCFSILPPVKYPWSIAYATNSNSSSRLQFCGFPARVLPDPPNLDFHITIQITLYWNWVYLSKSGILARKGQGMCLPSVSRHPPPPTTTPRSQSSCQLVVIQCLRAKQMKFLEQTKSRICILVLTIILVG